MKFTHKNKMAQSVNRPDTIRHPASNASPLRKLGIGAALTLPLIAQLASNVHAADTNAPLQTITKPNWLTDLSLGVKESYDDNVFLSGVKNTVQGYPTEAALQGVPKDIALATRYKSSFLTTASPKVGLNFAPLLGDQSILQSLTLGYAPDFVTYHGASSETYQAHKVSSGFKIKSDDLTVSAENTLNGISGDKYSPLYPGGLCNAYSTAAARERRDQIQDRAAATIQYNIDSFFIRPTSSLTYYDLRSAQLSKTQAGGLSGYQNYCDRYDINGGSDFGYQVITNFATTVGYRYGSQYQQQFSPTIDPLGLSSSSDYQRALFGVEGKPIKWLEAKVQIGPDFRDYGSHADMDDKHYVTYYGDASLTATLTPNDSISFKYKQFQWVSSTGRVPYFDSTYDLTYKRKLTSKLILELGARLLESDYTSGVQPGTHSPNQRDDSQTTLSAGLTYAINSHASLNLAYSLDLGQNFQDGITNPETREYTRNLFSLGALLKF
jgi:hypothetical protein